MGDIMDRLYTRHFNSSHSDLTSENNYGILSHLS